MFKISAHCNVTNSFVAGYPVLESISSFANFCDEVIVVDGGSTDGSLEEIAKIPKTRVIQGEKWERDFDWIIIAKNLKIGYGQCKSQWAFHFDVDYIFHEENVDALMKVLSKTHLPAIELKKSNFVLSDEYYVKDYYPFLVNKGGFPVITYGIGIDGKGNKSATFLKPIAKRYSDKNGIDYGDVIKMSICRVERCEVPIYTYDFTFMTKEQVIENRYRFENSLRRYRNLPELGKEECFNLFMKMMKSRKKLCGRKNIIRLGQHSQFIREKVKNMQSEMFGYSMWGDI